MKNINIKYLFENTSIMYFQNVKHVYKSVPGVYRKYTPYIKKLTSKHILKKRN